MTVSHWSVAESGSFAIFLLVFEGYFGFKNPLQGKIGKDGTKRGVSVLFTECLSVSRRSILHRLGCATWWEKGESQTPGLCIWQGEATGP